VSYHCSERSCPEDKIDDVKNNFYEELERVFDKFPKFHINILLGDFNANVGKENIFKPTIGNESLHEISIDNGIIAINFATSINLTVKSTMFLNRKIHKYTCRISAEEIKYYKDKANIFPIR
jgi:hypothetical protein